MKMKRYMCFDIQDYYPGWWFSDLEFTTDDLEQAKSWCKKASWYSKRQVVEFDESEELGYKVVFEVVNYRDGYD